MSRIPNREALRNSVASPDLQAWLDSLTDNSWLSRNEGPIALREQEIRRFFRNVGINGNTWRRPPVPTFPRNSEVSMG